MESPAQSDVRYLFEQLKGFYIKKNRDATGMQHGVGIFQLFSMGTCTVAITWFFRGAAWFQVGSGEFELFPGENVNATETSASA